MRAPAEVYRSSSRSMPGRLSDFEYDELYEVRRVRTDGTIKWKGEHVFVGAAMSGERVGIAPVGEADWYVHLRGMRLGLRHEESGLVVPLAEDGRA